MKINISMGMNTSPRKSRQEDGFYDYVSVAGINHHQYEYNRFVDEDLPLTARYEPTNKYDSNAIAVYGGTNLIGYIPRKVAEEISYLPEDDKKRLAIKETSRDEFGCVLSIYFSDDEDANYIQHPKTATDSGSCFYAVIFGIVILSIFCLILQLA